MAKQALGMIILAALAGAPVAAADDRHAADRVLSAMLACRATPDPRARATCYDAALDHLQQQIAARQVVIMDREQVAADRKSEFGFGGEAPHIPAPRAVKIKPAPGEEEVVAVDSTVASAAPYGYDQWTIRLATGAVWRSTESGIPAQPRTGAPVHIHRGIMGSFLMRVGNFRAVKAIRIN